MFRYDLEGSVKLSVISSNFLMIIISHAIMLPMYRIQVTIFLSLIWFHMTVYQYYLTQKS